jgi:hypothetical protein
VKDAPPEIERGNFTLAAVHALDELRGLGMRFDVDFLERQIVIAQEFPGAAAIGAPRGGIHADGDVHSNAPDCKPACNFSVILQ